MVDWSLKFGMRVRSPSFYKLGLDNGQEGGNTMTSDKHRIERKMDLNHHHDDKVRVDELTVKTVG